MRILLGGHLRRLREARGLTREAAGHVIRASESKMCRLELGRTGFKRRDVADLLALYGLAEETELDILMAMVVASNAPGWWQPYATVLPVGSEAFLGLEEAADGIRTFDRDVIPALLQTERYTRTLPLPSSPTAIGQISADQRVTLLHRRQQRIYKPDGPTLWAVIDEAVLRRPIGGPDVMREQLDHLISAAAEPHITVQVLPFEHGGHTPCPTFALLRFAEPDLPDMAYVEHLTGALYLDKPDEAAVYLAALDRLALAALTPDATTDLLHELAARFD